MRLNRNTALALALALASALAIPAMAADKEPTSDKEFVLHSIMCDTAEIQMAKLAMKTSSSADVKSFAKHMVADHTKHRKELATLAEGMKVEVMEGVSKEAQEEMTKLSKLTGKEFDAAYAKAQVMAHEKVLKMNEKWAKDAESPKVRAVAKKTAKVVEEHLTMAKKLGSAS